MDFSGLNQAVLGQLETLLAEYLPGGRKVGHEWVCGDIQGAPGDSCKTSLISGKGSDFATGEGWVDLVQLVSKQRGIASGAAAREVAIRIGFHLNGGNGSAQIPATTSKTARKAPQKAAEPIPADAPPLPDHWEFGPATASYVYESYFVHCRYDLLDGSKQFTPWTWRGGKWSPKAWPDPKPLFGRELLEQRPDAPVLVVEGEKCALAARALFLGLIVVTWSGGANQALKTDWTPLAGRKVEIWPDADPPGRKAAAKIAAALLKIGAPRIRVVDTADRPEGWDVADAAAEWDRAQIHAWIKERLQVVEAPQSPADLEIAPEPKSTTSIVAPARSSFVSWQALGLDCNEGGQPFATMANASAIIQLHPHYADKIWLDTFRQQVYHTLRSETPHPWTDADTRALTVQIQQQLKLPKMSMGIVADALLHAAAMKGRNSLTDWLDSLKWDGTPRLDDWLVDTLGVPKTPYTMAVSRNWPIGMVARAYRPGCQLDTMPVLEGRMGRGKSSFLERLASPWFAALPTGFGDKDFLQALQGQWLVEIPDMSAFSKREHSHILATITIRTDRYRASYGRITEDHPRVSSFAATSENDNYLQSAAGRRRYLPLRCDEINLDALELLRDQVFAQAKDQFRNDHTWWEFPTDETNTEQLDRVAQDPWYERVRSYVSVLKQVTASEVLSAESAVGFPLAQQTPRELLRVSAILRTLEWKCTVSKDRDRNSVRIWRAPETKLPWELP